MFRLPDIQGLRKETGARLASGHVLRCNKCKRIEDLTAEQAAVYLAKGWPECCGYTMGLVCR